MSFSPEWEQRYREGTHLSIWPWSDVVSLVMRHARPAGVPCRVLELGCGAGANIPFFLALGAEFHAIDGSESIVSTLRQRYPQLKNNIAMGDFTREIPFEGEFDLVLDRASLTHNGTAAIVRCLESVRDRLKPGGKFIGVDWFSTAYSDFAKGTPVEDDYSRTGYREGSFAGVGLVHFSDKPHLQALFKDFEIEILEHKTVCREIPDDGWHFASWNIVARKALRGPEAA